MAQPVEGARIALRSAADDFHISRQRLHHWLKREDCQKHCSWEQGRRYVKIEHLEMFAASTNKLEAIRRDHRPRGWLSSQAAADLVGCHPSTLYRIVKREAFAGVPIGIEVCWVKGVLFFNPRDLEQVRLLFKNQVLPGWAPVRPLAQACGVHPTSVVRWLRRHGVVTRLFRRPGDHRVVTCAPHSALERWLEAYREGENYATHTR